MKEITEPIIGIGLGVYSFCHVQIAFECKQCGGMSELVEDDDDSETYGVLLTGHSHHTHNHIYGISMDALAGAAEDVMPLYLDASIEGQINWHVVPGGLPLSYKQS
jgi:hypothetical protein